MENPSVRSAVRFDPAHALHVVMFVVMVGAVSWSIASFITPWIAVPIGTALTYAFARLAKVALGIHRGAIRTERVASGVGAWFVFCLTMGLSYGSLYMGVFAEPSAIRQLQEMRTPVQRQLDMVLADAVAARNAFDAWAKDSKQKAAAESRPVDGGGTCPLKSQTGGRRGPIAMWREAEASMASKVNGELGDAIAALEARVKAIPQGRPDKYAAATGVMANLNAAVAVAESVTHGSATRGALDTLDRQLNAVITWVDGTKFDCGDTARTDLMLSAQKALKALQAQPVLKPIEPSIDLSNRQDVATRGLLRSFNAGAKLFTFGMVGSFADDDLMQKALQQSGLINRESLGLGLSALLEMTLVFTAAIAARRGASPVPIDPLRGFRAWQAMADQAQGRNALIHMLVMPVAKAGFNFLFTSTTLDTVDGSSRVAPVPFKTSSHPIVEIEPDPDVPRRELGWAKELLPWLFAWHDKDYIVLPQDRAPKASLAARALYYNNAAALIGTDVAWDLVARHRMAARRLLRLLPDARSSTYEVYELAPPFAQAMRVSLLGG